MTAKKSRHDSPDIRHVKLEAKIATVSSRVGLIGDVQVGAYRACVVLIGSRWLIGMCRVYLKDLRGQGGV